MFRLLFLCAAFASAQPAQASSVDFRWSPDSGAFDAGGLSMRVSAGEATSERRILSGTGAETVYRGGLGVRSADDSASYDGTHQLDSYGVNDALIFRLDYAIRLESISFSMTDWWDRFDLYVGDDLTYARTFKADDLSGTDWESFIHLGEGYEATAFAIVASKYLSCGYDFEKGQACWTENSAFRVTGIGYSAVGPAAIPLPASAFLLLGAAAGLAALSRRKKATVGSEG